MSSRSLLLMAGLLVAMASHAACDLVSDAMAQSNQLLENADFKNGSQAWHGDGKAVFLKPDGTEGDETDAGVIPVLRISLAKGHPHTVYQTINSKTAAGKLHASVEVFASTDFKRSTHADDYGTDDLIPMTVTDFMIRLLPDYWEHDADLKPGGWTKVRYTYESLPSSDERTICFLVPPGDGFVYLKNPVLTP